MGSSDQESQERISETTQLMMKKAKLSGTATVGKNDRVVVHGRKPSVDLIDKKKGA